jgi:hypothetical protein
MSDKPEIAYLSLTQMPSELDAIRAKVISWARERQPCDGECDNLGICSQCADVYTIMAGVEQTFKEMGLRPKFADLALPLMPSDSKTAQAKFGLSEIKDAVRYGLKYGVTNGNILDCIVDELTKDWVEAKAGK